MKNRNENRPGYKETKVGWIPNEWGSCELGTAGKWKGGGTPSKTNMQYWEDGTIPWASSQDIKGSYLTNTTYKITGKAVAESTSNLIPKNALLMVTRSGILRHTFPVMKTTMPVAINQDIKALIPDRKHDVDYLLFSLTGLGNSILRLCSKVGTTVESVEYDWLKKYTIPLPPLPEQEKIAEVLGCWDEGIERLEDLIEQKRLRKKGLMQKLLTGEKRLPGFSEDWKEISLNQLMKESRVSGTDGASARKLTVKLHGKGVTEKKETRAGSDATKYYKRKAGQFIYSKLDFLNGAFGIIPTHLDGFESTLDLPAFDLNVDVINETWLISFLTREEFYVSCHALANGGRKARRINPKDFKHIKFPLPSLDEQKAIADVLRTADAEIELLEAELDGLREQKKGLMQKLLTGEVRCPEFRTAV